MGCSSQLGAFKEISNMNTCRTLKSSNLTIAMSFLTLLTLCIPVQATELHLNGLYRHSSSGEHGAFSDAQTDLIFGLELENPSKSAYEIISSEGAKRLSVRVLTEMTRDEMKVFWSRWLSNAYLKDTDSMNKQARDIMSLLDSFPEVIEQGSMISFQTHFGDDFSAYIDNSTNFYETKNAEFFNLWLKAWFLSPALGFDAGNAMMDPEAINPEWEALWSSRAPGLAVLF